MFGREDGAVERVDVDGHVLGMEVSSELGREFCSLLELDEGCSTERHAPLG